VRVKIDGGGAHWVVAVPSPSTMVRHPSNPLAVRAAGGRRWIARLQAARVLEFLCRPCGDHDGMEE
jgi:hypothetical protein